MDPKELDKETREALAEGEKVIRWVDSEDWKHVKGFLNSKLIQMDSISAIPSDLKVEDKIREIDIRNGVIAIVLEWVRELEGRAAQARTNRKAMQDVRDDGHIAYMP